MKVPPDPQVSTNSSPAPAKTRQSCLKANTYRPIQYSLTEGIPPRNLQSSPRALSSANRPRLPLLHPQQPLFPLHIPQSKLLDRFQSPGRRTRRSPFSRLAEWKVWVSRHDVLRVDANAEYVGILVDRILWKTSLAGYSRGR
jgi:hypothetical protein